MKTLLNKSFDEVNALLRVEYVKAIKSLYIMLVDMYGKIQEEEKPLVSHLYQYNRYYTLIEKITARLNDLGLKENTILSEGLINLYESTEQVLNNKFHLSTHIDEETLKNIISEDWVGDGNNFSSRIWKDKANMTAKLQSDIMQSIIKGDSIERYSDTLRSYLVNDAYYPTARLLRTEMARVQNKCTLNKYKEAGISKVKILTAGDDKVCEICIDKSKKEYEIDNAPMIPFHPNCRCTYQAVIE